MFGGVIPLTGDSITYTGPVQFQMGRSLNKVELKYIKGTGAFASGANKTKKTFREEYVVPYSLIGFYGIINENAAQSTELTQNDVALLMEGVWKGTKNLITRSKVGQTPRMLLKVNYSEENYFIGELKNYIKLATDLREEEIRDTSDYKLDVSDLLSVIEANSEKIESVEFKVNPRVAFIRDSNKINLNDLDLFKELDF
jgi:CRISPR-associated protein Csh2